MPVAGGNDNFSDTLAHHSTGQLPNLLLNEFSGSGGKLIHSLDTDQILPVNRPCIGGAGVLAHKDGSDPDALLPQSTNLLGGRELLDSDVLDAALLAVCAAIRSCGFSRISARKTQKEKFSITLPPAGIGMDWRCAWQESC